MEVDGRSQLALTINNKMMENENNKRAQWVITNKIGTRFLSSQRKHKFC